MNVKPKYIPYNIRRMCKVSLIEYVHENDVETMYLEVNLTDDGEPIELLGSYNYSASMINKATKSLIKDDVACSLNESGNVVIKIDDFHTLGAQDILIELTVSNQNRSKVLVLPFPLWIHVNASILDDAQVTPESEGTIPDLLKEAKEQLERVEQLSDGKSAYEVAVDNGFVGTEQEWLASLKGAQGDDYVLTTQDKTDIANIVLSELPTTQGVQYGNTSN